MTVLTTDSFNRANNTTTLGSTDNVNGGTTSYTWQALVGTWGIYNNQAYNANGTSNGVAVIDVGQSDVDLIVTLSADYSTSKIIFRCSTSNTYLCYNQGTLYQVNNGAFTSLASGITTNANGDVMKISCSGSTIVIYKNGTQVYSGTSTFNQTATKFGISSNTSNAALFDNFEIDVSSTGTTHTQTFTDSVTTSDNAVKIASKILTDSQTTNDAFTKSISFVKSDSVTSSDSIAKQTLKSLSDSVSSLDSITKQITKVLADSQSFSDTITKLITKTLTESIALSDAFSQSKLAGVKTQTLTDSLTLSDTFVKTVIKNMSDSQTITDAISKILSVSKSDTVSLSDAISSGLLFSRSYNDSVSVSDSINRGITKSLSDNISIADAITKYLQKLFGDNVTIIDSFQTHLPNAPTLIGTITLSGNIILNVYLKGDIATNIYLKGGYDVTQENQNFEMYVGETKKVNIPITNQDGTPANLNGSSIKWVLKKYVTSGTVLVTKTTTNGGITISNGTLTVNLSPSDTLGLVAGNYYHEASLDDAQGDDSVLTTGTATLKARGT